MCKTNNSKISASDCAKSALLLTYVQCKGILSRSRPHTHTRSRPHTHTRPSRVCRYCARYHARSGGGEPDFSLVFFQKNSISFIPYRAFYAPARIYRRENSGWFGNGSRSDEIAHAFHFIKQRKPSDIKPDGFFRLTDQHYTESIMFKDKRHVRISVFLACRRLWCSNYFSFG